MWIVFYVAITTVGGNVINKSKPNVHQKPLITLPLKSYILISHLQIIKINTLNLKFTSEN